ncbi:MAG: hypothetical protein Q9221_002968 [Calogaya cf. arnoldii]
MRFTRSPAGHRITLTYNLSAHEHLGGVFESPSTIGINYLPLYDHVKEALASPDFFPKGGTLGFHCVHAYAHTNDRVAETLPYALKGVDAVVFSIFKRLNLSVSMRAVMEMEDIIGEDEYARHEEEEEEDDDMKDAKLVATGLHGIQILDEGGEDVDAVEYETPLAFDGNPLENFGTFLPIKGLETQSLVYKPWYQNLKKHT